ncbi:hypothetical protein [Thioclava sp. L04-15]|uniref:hypothetical protein n=1 Tax=Thioclava sp. L04-15 TaxID=1915318 RepID=UPI0011BA81EC|nr:hypothetical protein [Thioclava sp. L04-15]TNE93216.1 MAG: hypothetical protein EP337_04010 [Paracoccaceae bacterium]
MNADLRNNAVRLAPDAHFVGSGFGRESPSKKKCEEHPARTNWICTKPADARHGLREKRVFV